MFLALGVSASRGRKTQSQSCMLSTAPSHKQPSVVRLGRRRQDGNQRCFPLVFFWSSAGPTQGGGRAPHGQGSGRWILGADATHCNAGQRSQNTAIYTASFARARRRQEYSADRQTHVLFLQAGRPGRQTCLQTATASGVTGVWVSSATGRGSTGGSLGVSQSEVDGAVSDPARRVPVPRLPGALSTYGVHTEGAWADAPRRLAGWLAGRE